jgi:hypothetical protein
MGVSASCRHGARDAREGSVSKVIADACEGCDLPQNEMARCGRALYALRSTLYALRSTLYALRSTLYALRSLLYVLRYTSYAFRLTLAALRPRPYALHPRPKAQGPTLRELPRLRGDRAIEVACVALSEGGVMSLGP